MLIISKKVDFLLIKFPIFFPLIYFLILKLFPNYENHLIIITILLLAEPHFAATWPFFLNERNKSYIIENRIPLIILPILLILIGLILFFFSKSLLLLIFFAANIFHVTRQSIGVSKIYLSNDVEKNFQTNVIYFYNFIFFFIGVLRFYFKIFPANFLFELNFFTILSVILVLIIYVIKFKNYRNIFTLLSGIIIFYPVCFVVNPVHAILMGVTIHYSQYLVMTYCIEKRRKLKKSLDDNNSSSPILKNFIFIIVSYSIIMTLLSFFRGSESLLLQNLIIIPIISQLLHFYIDSHLWKFSKSHHRENTLKFLVK
jgi:hypothetical protein